jgi:hypothetical protein
MVQMTRFAGNMSRGRSKVAFRGAKDDINAPQSSTPAILSCDLLLNHAAFRGVLCHIADGRRCLDCHVQPTIRKGFMSRRRRLFSVTLRVAHNRALCQSWRGPFFGPPDAQSRVVATSLRLAT